jgi:hypothetical protein
MTFTAKLSLLPRAPWQKAPRQRRDALRANTEQHITILLILLLPLYFLSFL